MVDKYPSTNEYWEDKRARFDQIRLPSYVVASYSTGLHTLGSFRGFDEMASDEKWYLCSWFKTAPSHPLTQSAC